MLAQHLAALSGKDSSEGLNDEPEDANAAEESLKHKDQMPGYVPPVVKPIHGNVMVRSRCSWCSLLAAAAAAAAAAPAPVVVYDGGRRRG